MRYPEYVAWEKSMEGVSSAKECFSKRTWKRIKKTEDALQEANYRFSVDPLTDEKLEQFFSIYKRYIGAKEEGIVRDVCAKVRAKQERGYTYEIISLLSGDEMIGGFLYSYKSQSISTAYKSFPHVDVDTAIGLSYVAEKHLFERTIELGMQKIIHGRDKNGFGKCHLTIGLAMFKLAIGCFPKASNWRENQFFDLDIHDNYDENALFFICDEKGDRCQKAVLFSKEEEEALQRKYGVIFQNIEVEVVSAV